MTKVRAPRSRPPQRTQRRQDQASGERREKPSSGRARLELDERRAQLLALGVRFFSERPYDQVAIDEIARAAGISKGLLYHYYPTKRDFYVAALRAAAQQLIDATYTDPLMPPLQRMQLGLDRYLAYVDGCAASYAALLRGGIGSDPEVAAIIEGTRRQFFDRLLAGLPTEKPTPALRTVLRGFIGTVEAASLDWLEHRDLSSEALRDLLIGVLLAVLQVAVGKAADGPT
jgi:AcrR family transcriptional regulator